MRVQVRGRQRDEEKIALRVLFTGQNWSAVSSGGVPKICT